MKLLFSSHVPLLVMMCVVLYLDILCFYADIPPTEAWRSHHSQQQTVLTLQDCLQDQWWEKTFAGTYMLSYLYVDTAFLVLSYFMLPM